MTCCEPHSPQTHLATRITVLVTSSVVLCCLIVALSVPYESRKTVYVSAGTVSYGFGFFSAWVTTTGWGQDNGISTSSRGADLMSDKELAAFSLELVGCISAFMCVLLSAILLGIQKEWNNNRPCLVTHERGLATALLVFSAATFVCCLVPFCVLVAMLSEAIKTTYVGLWILLPATLLAVPGVVLTSLEATFGVTYCIEGCCDPEYYCPDRAGAYHSHPRAARPPPAGCHPTSSFYGGPNASPYAPGYRFKAHSDLHRYTR